MDEMWLDAATELRGKLCGIALEIGVWTTLLLGSTLHQWSPPISLHSGLNAAVQLMDNGTLLLDAGHACTAAMQGETGPREGLPWETAKFWWMCAFGGAEK